MKTNSQLQFDIPFGKKTISANFCGGNISSDGGLVLLREVDRELGLTERLAVCVKDERDQSKVRQSVKDMLIQRIFGIACGYEDCNDHDTLRSDPAHGQQELEFFHGFYGCHCYLPLLVYLSADDGEQELVAAVLRPGNVHAGHKLVSVLKRLVPRLKEAFPDTELVFRGDAGMAKPEVYDYLEDEGLFYLICFRRMMCCFVMERSFFLMREPYTRKQGRR